MSTETAPPAETAIGRSRPSGTIVPPSVSRARRRRRPSGAPPPLPRSIGFSGASWLVAMTLLLVWLVIEWASESASRLTARADAAVLRGIARARTEWLTDVMHAIDRVGSGWTVTIVAFALLAAMMAFRRWRHFFTFLAAIVVLATIGGEIIYEVFGRPRPVDVTIIGRWAGYSMPAAPVAVLAFVIVGITYALIVPGRPRQLAKTVGTVVIVLFALSQLYLAKFHPTDIVVGVALAVGIPVNAFRIFTPNESFPVSYRRGKSAHLDIGGRRGEALREAIEAQLGLVVVDMRHIGLAGSGGSTPLLITVAGEPDTKLFGKLYAMNHVRADRWYKLGRTLLYGRLEDEAPFQSVRRLVQYEDYTLRLMQDLGLPTPAAYGIVEITPEREYLIVMQFFEGSPEIGEAEVDDNVIDEGLLLIRKLWDSGLAHRDIKPANLLVRDGRILLIDVAFAQFRPSPWRQAVDLANMMLVLAVRTDAERVYERALQFFTPDEIAEAFAAARGIASPTQLRSMMKLDGRDLLGQFRALAPERPPISLQRWSFKRIALAGLIVFALIQGAAFTWNLFTPTHDLGVLDEPNCGTDNVMVLMAQSVPTAELVPCVATLPAGWEVGGASIRRDRGRFWLDSDVAGKHAVEATLLPPDDCDVEGATSVPSDEVGVRRFERPERLPPDLRSTRWYVFEGGCVVYRFAFSGDATASLMFAAETALAFQDRQELVDEVHDRTGLRLCGHGVDCPGGS